VQAEKIERFINQTSSEVTLGEFLKLTTTSPIKQNKSLREIREINMVELLLDSEYRDIAESMNSNQLDSLVSIFSADSLSWSFPKDIIRNRALAKAKLSANPTQSLIPNYISTLLSPSEQSLLPEDGRPDEIDRMLLSYRYPAATPMIVFAAIAEVIVVKSFDKAFEVASELRHLNSTDKKDKDVYEATVALIAEALEVTADELPFGWAAQMSEHSWVLSTCPASLDRNSEETLSLAM
jgi:hypothetical protein